ncbi:uncharacterized protein LOC110026205 [Phalaenopsis equestris]|uniref:uncharacterized protein LOC110026205 n=1 Tax=Phalaenopsis equestris TaxID=78828 RepID=UPI0009E3ED01|nr:uncharacterized protein LOC110026205 [Phalaenopsis equestris]
MLPPHCCNLARNLSLPLISRVSRRPVSFSVSLSQAASVSCAAERSTAIDPAGRAIDTRVLPGLVSRRGRGQKTPVGKRMGFRSNFSSWEESAEAYFSRNGVKLRDEREDGYRRRRSLGDPESENGVSAEVREEETQGKQELVSKSADSPRWNRIKNMHRDFSDSSSRSEKPDLRRWNKRETWSKPRSKEATETSVPKMVGQCVYGVGPVLAALTAARREFHALYVHMAVDGVNGDNGDEDEEMDQKCFGEDLDSFLAVESLNVSVAAGVLLYHLVGDAKHPSVEKMKRISS